MDPVSVLHIAGTAANTAKAAWSIGETLYTFFNDVANIDQTVKNLIAEVKALSKACDLVDQRLRGLVQDFEADIRSQRGSDSNLWPCIKSQLADSESSISQLRAALESVRNERSNKLTQAWRQVKLNMQARDIEDARNRIRSHTAGLQTVLQTVAM